MERVIEPAVLEDHVSDSETKGLWVFGYGSLCWKPGFEFHKAVLGSVNGFQRRFWQGNATHRGTTDKPGRVATLVDDSEGKVYGVAFAISEEAAIPYLNHRECEQGGYIQKFTDFYSLEGGTIKVLVYMAAPSNIHWLGDSSLEEMADQIVTREGPSGHNVEYLMRLAQFMRRHFPGKHDSHLFDIEEKVLSLIQARKICLNSLMGSGEGCVTYIVRAISRDSSPSQGRRNGEARIETFEHTARVPGKKLRCLNI
ncbi:glutathione-specific gamma-glutamylcyclotransferase 1 [Euwallacea fornicatus]|uniref:glutathione-specific gamma-glutamylcyclotransferase 1 n=1 Tax=Euwallacea fornicatus TaxID=995702 RepID=UPI00338F819F